MPNLKVGNVIEALGLLITGSARVESSSGPRTLSVAAPVASAAQVAFDSGTSRRWGIGKEATAEGGSDAGSDFYIDRYSDAGSFLSTVMRAFRASGIVDFPHGAAGASPGSGEDNTRLATTEWTRDRIAEAAGWHAEIHPRESATRTTGAMDTPLGVTVPVAMTLTRVYARFGTADGSGSTTITIYKNGSATGMPTITITSGNTTGVWASTPVALAQNDVLTAEITTLGGTPGNALSILYTGAPT